MSVESILRGCPGGLPSNAILNGVETRVFFEESDLLEAVTGGPFQLIAANLPYIPSEKMLELPREIRDYEPARALDGGPGGLAFYRELLPQAFGFLSEPGSLLLEVGDAAQIRELCQYIDDAWSSCHVLKDLGDRDRVLVLKKGKSDADLTPQG